MIKQSAFFISGLLAAFVAADPIAYAYQTANSLPTNQKCENQLRSLIRELNFPGNGSSTYNPWVRQCNYKYFKDGEISTYTWHPDLK